MQLRVHKEGTHTMLSISGRGVRCTTQYVLPVWNEGLVKKKSYGCGVLFRVVWAVQGVSIHLTELLGSQFTSHFRIRLLIIELLHSNPLTVAE